MKSGCPFSLDFKGDGVSAAKHGRHRRGKISCENKFREVQEMASLA